jgi:hypothetical protein
MGTSSIKGEGARGAHEVTGEGGVRLRLDRRLTPTAMRHELMVGVLVEKPPQEASDMRMFRQRMHQAMARRAQADEVVRRMVFPVPVKMVERDSTVSVRDIAQDTATLVAIPRLNASFAIGNAKLFLSLQCRAHRIDDTLAAVRPHSFNSRKHMFDTMAFGTGSQPLIAVHTQAPTHMVFGSRLRQVLLFFRTVVTSGFAIFRKAPAASLTLAMRTTENGTNRIVVNAHDSRRFADVTRLRIDLQDALVIDLTRNHHNVLPFFSGRLNMLTCTKYGGKNQHISNHTAMRFA